MGLVKSLPEVRALLAEYPDAGIYTLFWFEAAVQKNLESIRRDCGESFKVASYYKVDVFDGVFDAPPVATLWLDAATHEVACVVKSPGIGGFCGNSTYAPCVIDVDCVGGSSGQCVMDTCRSTAEAALRIPQSVKEAEWCQIADIRVSECLFSMGHDYPPTVNCLCVDNQCQWGRGVKVAPPPVPPNLVACETLDEKTCGTRVDCKPVYGASRCECQPDGSQQCTTDTVFKGCEAPEPDEVGIVREYFHQQWFRVADGCGTFNQETCMMEPDRIYSQGKTEKGYVVVVETYCGFWPPMDSAPLETFTYLVKFDGTIVMEPE